ncbi:uncharacterized protein PAC_18529 [Phialocephala subalpina]|uniref:Clr5 domain-containing protein n=1 Tax=Phialocephala subalpina TaxID=576137 RepID=A0A1L7XUD0_9HELO|nr:uncharacterized protein PAC_18529 [Phialocephala subalpina]
MSLQKSGAAIGGLGRGALSKEQWDSLVSCLGKTALVVKRAMEELYIHRGEGPRSQLTSLKSIVKHKYLIENKTVEATATYLGLNHGFKPTRKQLLLKLKAWGYQKNVKCHERRAIIAGGSELINTIGTTFRGRKFDKAKLNRWRRREKTQRGKNRAQATASEGRSRLPDLQSRTSTTRNTPAQTTYVNFDLSHPSPGPEQQASVTSATRDSTVCSDSGLERDDIQSTGSSTSTLESTDSVEIEVLKSVDVIRSPQLGRLIGALTVFVDCITPNRTGAGSSSRWTDYQETRRPSARQSGYQQLFVQWIPQSPCNEPWPFSSSNWSDRRMITPHYQLSATSSFLTESECKIRICRAKRSGILDKELLRSMWIIADTHEEMERDAEAECWYRRIVTHTVDTSRRNGRWNRPYETLKACLSVIRSMRRQSKFKQANQQHKALHRTIMQLGPQQDLAIESMRVLAALSGSLGKFEEEEKIRREILQIYIATRGFRSKETTGALCWFCRCLRQSDRFEESEHILHSTIQLKMEGMAQSEPCKAELKSFLQCVTSLAKTLDEQGKIEEARNLLETATQKYRSVVSVGASTEWDLEYEVVDNLCKRRLWEESLEALQGLLAKHGTNLNICRHGDAMARLAHVLSKLKRHSEAVEHSEKAFFDYSSAYGLKHRATMWSVMKMGYCYADQGLHGAALSYYQGIIDELDNLDDGEPDSTRHWREKVRNWFLEIQRESWKGQS